MPAPDAFFVRVALHIVHDEEVRRGEAPHAALPGALGVGLIHLVDAPVVGLAPFERARHRRTSRPAADGPCRCRPSRYRRRPRRPASVAEVHVVLSGFVAGKPLERRILDRLRLAVARRQHAGPRRHLQPAGRNDLTRQPRPLPGQLGHGPAAVLVPFHADGVEPVGYQVELGDVVRRALVNPAVGDQTAIDPQPHAVIAGGDDPVGPCRRDFQVGDPAGGDVVASDSPATCGFAPVVVDRGFDPRQNRVAFERHAREVRGLGSAVGARAS